MLLLMVNFEHIIPNFSLRSIDDREKEKIKAQFCFCSDGLFLTTGGTEGLFAQKTLEITNEILSAYKNQGPKKQTGF